MQMVVSLRCHVAAIIDALTAMKVTSADAAAIRVPIG